MNDLGISLIWLAGQVTLLCGVTAVIYLIARRRHPSAGATAALSGLLLTAVLTLLVVSPWPRWTLGDDPIASQDRIATSLTLPGLPDIDLADNTPTLNDGRQFEADSVEALFMYWRGMWQELLALSRRQLQDGSQFTGWFAITVFSLMVLGAVRLLAGWVTVQRCLRRSTLVDDRMLCETVDVLRAKLSCGRDVELRQSNDVASAATVGWRKPVILLPRNWRDWSDTERQTVLAHELAHVTAGDAASWLAAQVGLLLNFYHPLVHWLTHRLRLEQELAADAMAARITGNSQTYLTTLAELAVRQPDRPVAWPVQAFLPTRGTLLRRIEMLRDTKAQPERSSAVRRGTVIVLTLATAITVAGLRPSTTPKLHAADDPADAEQTEEERLAKRRVSFNHIKQLGLAFHNYYVAYDSFPPPVLLGPDGKTPYSWRVALLPYVDEPELYKQYDRNQPWDSARNQKVLERMPDVYRSPYDAVDSTQTSYFVFQGKGTALSSDDKEIKISDVTDGTSNTILTVEAKRDVPWTKPEDLPFSGEKPLPSLGGWEKGGFVAGLVDGSAQFYSDENGDDILKPLVTRDGKEIIDYDAIKR